MQLNKGFGDVSSGGTVGSIYNLQWNIIPFYYNIPFNLSGTGTPVSGNARIGRKVHVRTVKVRVIIPQDYCNTKIRFIFCKFRDAQFDKTA